MYTNSLEIKNNLRKKKFDNFKQTTYGTIGFIKFSFFAVIN